jgi:hypothetical protein
MRRIILIAVLVIVVLLLIAQFGPAVVRGETAPPLWPVPRFRRDSETKLHWLRRGGATPHHEDSNGSFHTPLVIPRACGVSSTRRPIGEGPLSLEYWIARSSRAMTVPWAAQKLHASRTDCPWPRIAGTCR